MYRYYLKLCHTVMKPLSKSFFHWLLDCNEVKKIPVPNGTVGYGTVQKIKDTDFRTPKRFSVKKDPYLNHHSYIMHKVLGL